jgi:DNA-binding NarL/FixJ family response regulator
MTRIAIVEGHRILRKGIEQVLARRAGFEVVASVGRAEDLEVQGDAPDVVIADPSPYEEDAFAAVLAALGAVGPVLVVSAAGDRLDSAGVLAALRAGVFGVVARDADDDELLMAVEAVAHGRLYLSAELAQYVHAELGKGAGEPRRLAPREAEALRWIARGCTHGQIARRMGLTEETVNTYVKRIRAKLNAGNKAELTRMALELGYLTEESETATAEVLHPRRWSRSAPARSATGKAS